MGFSRSDRSFRMPSTKYRRAVPVGLVVLLVGASCGDDPVAPEAVVPARVVVVSGGDQTQTVGTALAQPLRVRVTDASGTPAPGVTVSWTVTGGGGSVSSASASTSGTGEASTTWTMGTAAGPQTATATVSGLTPAPFAATATAGAPVEIQLVGGDAQQGEVGSTLTDSVAVGVADAYGNPVPDVAVVWEVTAGGGSLGAPGTGTDSNGEARAAWTLGTTVGAGEATATVTGLPPVTFTATGVAAAASTLVKVGGDGQSAEVTTALADSLAVRAEDAYGNPVAGVPITWTVAAGGGALSAGATTTDAAGETRVLWTLGTTSGPGEVTVQAVGVASATFASTATAGAAVTLTRMSGDGQSGAPLTVLPDSLVVRVGDAHGNPVPGVAVSWALTGGGGMLSPGSVVTDASGLARTAWTMGSTVGPVAATATVAGLSSVGFTATNVGTAGFNLAVTSVHLNQGNQNAAGTVGGVAGRAGLLRVVVTASEANTYTPDVRVRLYQGGSLFREVLLGGPSGGVPTAPDLSLITDTWNLELTAAEVVAGLSVEAVVDPGSTITESVPTDNVFPSGGGSASLDVQALSTFNLIFIPVYASVHGTTGSVTSANVEDFLTPTRRWLPMSGISSTVRTTAFSTDADLRTGAGWSTLLSDIQALRTAEGATNQYYHGIVGAFSGIAYGGLGYLLGSPGSNFRSAVSYDRPTWGPEAVAHELGHNLGRAHSPCGVSPFDPGFPYPDGSIGQTGYDIVGGGLVPASGRYDYMSYCNPAWTSDYTFDAIVDWRRADPLAAPAAGAGGGQPREGLLVWGRVDAEGITVNPAFTLTAEPALPEGRGPYRLRGLAADGGVVFDHAFTPSPVADAPTPDERHFSFFLPLDPADLEGLERIEVSGPGGSAVRASSRATAARARTVSGPAGRASVAWDSASHPMAILRDADSGRILGMARHGSIELPVVSAGSGRYEVVLSDGVRSETVRPEAR